MKHELVGVRVFLLLLLLLLLLLPIPSLLILVFPLFPLLPLSIPAIVAVIVVEVTRLVDIAVSLSLLVALVPVLLIGTVVLALFPARGRFPVPWLFLESGLFQERNSFPVLDKPTVPTRVRYKPLLAVVSPPSRPVINITTSVFRR